MLTLIGKGSFGHVYLVQKRNDEKLFAMKVLNKNKLESYNLLRYAVAEKNILAKMDHPFIVGLHWAF